MTMADKPVHDDGLNPPIPHALADKHKVWVVIDVGCHECGVGSESVGIYDTEVEAKAAAAVRDKETGCWRDGGQTYCEIFEMET